jgi:hippurate hydrolase
MAALRETFGAEHVPDPGPVTGSEDFGVFGSAAGVPSCYWLFGGVDPAAYLAAIEAGTVERDIPTNHSPLFAPMPEPTIDAGVSAMVTCALAWLR